MSHQELPYPKPQRGFGGTSRGGRHQREAGHSTRRGNMRSTTTRVAFALVIGFLVDRVSARYGLQLPQDVREGFVILLVSLALFFATDVRFVVSQIIARQQQHTTVNTTVINSQVTPAQPPSGEEILSK
jgi:hypothetical protein